MRQNGRLYWVLLDLAKDSYDLDNLILRLGFAWYIIAEA